MLDPEKNGLQNSSSAEKPASWASDLTRLLRRLRPLTHEQRLTSTPEERAKLEAEKLIPFARIDALRQTIADVLTGISKRLPDYDEGNHYSRLYGRQAESFYRERHGSEKATKTVVTYIALGLLVASLAYSALTAISEEDVIREAQRLYPEAQVIAVDDIVRIRGNSWEVLAAGKIDGDPFTAKCTKSVRAAICSIMVGGDQSVPSSNQNEKPRSLPR